MSVYPKSYDVIVVGAGHAGCEAALAAARMGCQTLLLSIYLDTVAHMPCSPSVGGLGKGHLVKEIDALGGEMAKIADQSAIQYRTLNTRKGPAVQGTRTQNDKSRYRAIMKNTLERQKGLDCKQTTVEKLLVEGDRVVGVRDHLDVEFLGSTVVLTTGTFLHGLIHIGSKKIPAGRAGEFPADNLATNLSQLGFQMGRMKTGTPARLRRDTIDFSQFQEQEGEENPRPFSLFTEGISLPQLSCYIGHTARNTHEIIRRNIQLSPLYSGAIKGVSARYCPSLEDKIMKFPHKECHQIILEPEGLETAEIYASGTGNSLPYEIQLDLVHSIAGLEEAEIMRPAYAIEYDFVQPTQLRPTLETKKIKGLYMAGQINGTSGYEEAAAQGMWAGINAALSVQKRGPFILDRSEAYMAVMVDDLVTRGTREPYRMFTSRAEYRLLLREDNADFRLMEKGHEIGLIDRTALKEMRERRRQVQDELERLKKVWIKPSPVVNAYLNSKRSARLDRALPLAQLLKRPELGYRDIQQLPGGSRQLPARVAEQVEIQCKYEGYLERQQAEVEKFKNLEKMLMPADFPYEKIQGLSHEVVQRLIEIQPTSLGQASRISGITPAALSILMVYLKRYRQQGCLSKGKMEIRQEPIAGREGCFIVHSEE
ncbi:MAG: tRNA uridine-5-carboxymethylaminomethyl(34) synthesis enzyme MnmG [Deltaproteobacteria bacterium]|nr:tRNA uridine-5-carboxymethylaminomethyl(34) synthesis enzyme MnmG [Deltaproteobacteria bacterium]MBW2071390.1 tRNA uridine-5-carboxymethylaminomethyl(34) synthesis enzyme MnmG [Deltaproteobacteria bacterium]